MYRKNFHEYLDNSQDHSNLVAKYGDFKKELIENLKAHQIEDQIVTQATAAIIAAINKQLK